LLEVPVAEILHQRTMLQVGGGVIVAPIDLIATQL
jgi:hypothetical protein